MFLTFQTKGELKGPTDYRPASTSYPVKKDKDKFYFDKMAI
jgi:hypothetical protein